MKNHAFIVPKSVKIGAITYAVKVVDEIKNKPDLLGHCSFYKQEIEILKCKSDSMFNTFLHEILHTFNYEEDNIKIQNLADRLHDFIKQNPKVFERQNNVKKS